MTTYAYDLIEYDPERPWIVLGSSRRTVELPDDQSFDQWAQRTWADDRYRVLADRQTARWP
jgi:hypothetical protein